ncbi:hypothetical protein [Blastopirellula marina]|uniref:MotA/TolQ/ExbB proton channel domain-containing protein n=1 Tax=Blastopirellula marina TaxID=124 RepID=A0A2S8GM61_9BACT|nr:hypothetical protein [Blastopirellula marina]PQO45523.1 hypothetical protein C5Y93_13830 [Blastopirellula marina]
MSRPVASLSLLLLAMFVLSPPAWAQDAAAPDQPEPAVVKEAATPEAGAPEVTTHEEATVVTPPVPKEIKEPPTELPKEVEEIADKVDQNESAQGASAGILTPIYMLAEWFSFPLFHWLAFGLMFAGVVSYALQLVIGKLVVMAHMGFSIREIISDAFGLVVSVIGLVLTTQAAVENSSFTQSPFLVISASLVGAMLGVLMYFWGQSQEVDAARGRSAHAAELKAKQARAK